MQPTTVAFNTNKSVRADHLCGSDQLSLNRADFRILPDRTTRRNCGLPQAVFAAPQRIT